MKYLILFMLMLSFNNISFGQKVEPSQAQLDLLQKSDTQYKAGWAFLGGGLALTITSIAIPRNFNPDTGNDNRRVTSFLAWTGFLSIGTSIPLFLSSGQNARLAAKLSLQSQTVHQPFLLPGQPRSLPSLSLKIPL